MKIDYRISCLRIFATLAVIWLHTCSTIVENFEVTSNQAIFLNSCHYLMNWSVPVFFMITGALFLRSEKRFTVYQAMTKYCRRVLLALLVFGIPFAMMRLVAEQRSLYLGQIPSALFCIVQGKSFSHLWYLYELIGLYLVLPILKSFISNSSDKEQAIVLLMLFIFDSIFPTIEVLLNINISFILPITYPVLYLMLGHLMIEHSTFGKRFLILGGGDSGSSYHFFRIFKF